MCFICGETGLSQGTCGVYSERDCHQLQYYILLFEMFKNYVNNFSCLSKYENENHGVSSPLMLQKAKPGAGAWGQRWGEGRELSLQVPQAPGLGCAWIPLQSLWFPPPPPRACFVHS